MLFAFSFISCLILPNFVTKMFSDIVAELGLNNCSDPKFIVASKDLKSDLNFIFCEILSFYIKKDYSVILVNLAQSSNHYFHLLQKSNINMRQLRDQGKFTVIDILSEAEKVMCEKTESTSLGNLFSDPSGHDCLKDLYLCIKKSFELLKSTEQCVLFFDEISILLNMGVHLSAIEPFVQYCVSLTSSTTNPSVLFFGGAYDVCDVQNVKLINFLLHLSNIGIKVEGLKTGYSKDAHGKIMLSVENELTLTSTHQKLLFKVTEKGAKLLTLGL